MIVETKPLHKKKKRLMRQQSFLSNSVSSNNSIHGSDVSISLKKKTSWTGKCRIKPPFFFFFHTGIFPSARHKRRQISIISKLQSGMGKISGLVKRKGASLGIRIDEANGGFDLDCYGHNYQFKYDDDGLFFGSDGLN